MKHHSSKSTVAVRDPRFLARGERSVPAHACPHHPPCIPREADAAKNAAAPLGGVADLAPGGRLEAMLAEQNSALEDLNNALDRLFKSIEPVCIPVPPAVESINGVGDGDGGPPLGMACEKLAHLTRNIRRMTAAVHQQAYRVEV